MKHVLTLLAMLIAFTIGVNPAHAQQTKIGTGQINWPAATGCTTAGNVYSPEINQCVAIPSVPLGQTVVYASKIAGVTPGVSVVPGSSATGTVDSSGAFNDVIAGGNVDLEVDSGFALSNSLFLYSNTTIHCTAPQYGFIMQAAANVPVLINAHPQAPTTSNGTGGYLVSNIGDSNIRISGCQINENSTQSVTGSNVLGTPHTTTGESSPKFVMGVEFYAVNGLVFDHNEVYDSGAFAFYGSNDEYIRNEFNYFHQPTPMVHFKNTDGFHLDGPIQFVFSTGNRINAGDDSISICADDGQTPGTGDPNGPYIKSFVKWGTVTDVEVSNEILDNTFFGVRLLSTNDLMDRISFTNINGQACGNTGTLVAAYPGVGPGNLGTIKFDGWNLATSGACNDYGQEFNFNISSNIQALQIAHLQLTNPGVNWPVIYQNGGNVDLLSLRDWDLNTLISGFSNVVYIPGGNDGQISASGINWQDNPARGTPLFGGFATPGTNLNLSNYNGPNRILGTGYTPSITNGDAFSNTYGTTYVSTVFNEASSGTALAGTTPATCSGCGAWTASSGGPSGSQAWTYGTSSVTLGGQCTSGTFCPVTTNPGQTNYQLTVNFTTITNPNMDIVMRWTNSSNFIAWEMVGTNTWKLCDVVAGVATCSATQTLSTAAGTYVVQLIGNYSALYSPSGYITANFSTSNISGGAGVNSTYTGSATTLATMNSFKIMSVDN